MTYGQFEDLIGQRSVAVLPARCTLEGAYGSVAPLHRPENFRRIGQEAKAHKARRSVDVLPRSSRGARGR